MAENEYIPDYYGVNMKNKKSMPWQMVVFFCAVIVILLFIANIIMEVCNG